MIAIMDSPPLLHRKKSAKERREQLLRSNARTIGRILKMSSAISSHRGCQPSKLFAAVTSVLSREVTLPLSTAASVSDSTEDVLLDSSCPPAKCVRFNDEVFSIPPGPEIPPPPAPGPSDLEQALMDAAVKHQSEIAIMKDMFEEQLKIMANKVQGLSLDRDARLLELRETIATLERQLLQVESNTLHTRTDAVHPTYPTLSGHMGC